MKKYTSFLISAVLCFSLITGKIVLVYAQQEEVRLEESEQVDNTEQETAESDTDQSEAETPENSSESEIPDGPEVPDGSEVPGSDHDQTEEEEQQTDSDGDEGSAPQEESEILKESETQEESKIPDENQVPEETKVQEENEGNPDVAAAMEAAYTSFYDHIGDIAGLLDMSDDYTLIEGDDNFCEALAVYAIKHDQTVNYPYGVEITSEADFDELQSIYWRLNVVNGAKNEKESVIRVTRLSGVDVYALSGTDKKVFQSLNTDNNREKIRTLLSD
ncbi:hypothetical protein [Lacrimispora sp.]|jgi:DNA mismatch repair ATPase MutL|uniref:hypothetical protein n=1 Tax=Lacrimispora sp. TaxID=2719234 RepID=UPI00289A54A0|nr:hypothetical protein [Lacrimispora sp.]